MDIVDPLAYKKNLKNQLRQAYFLSSFSADGEKVLYKTGFSRRHQNNYLEVILQNNMSPLELNHPKEISYILSRFGLKANFWDTYFIFKLSRINIS